MRFSVLGLVLLSSLSFAGDKPNAQVTADYLSQKVSEIGKFEYQTPTHNCSVTTEASFGKDCSIKTLEKTRCQSKANSTSIYAIDETHTANLGQIQPNLVMSTNGDTGVVLVVYESMNKQKNVTKERWQRNYHGRDRESTTAQVTGIFSTHANVQGVEEKLRRINNAFTHMVDLCGGKMNPSEKDPFAD